jgi:hypothetical protein
VVAYHHLVAAYHHLVAAYHYLVAAYHHSTCIRYVLTSVLIAVKLRTAEKQVRVVKITRCHNCDR